jgi:ATP-binding cassette subfamily B protein
VGRRGFDYASNLHGRETRNLQVDRRPRGRAESARRFFGVFRYSKRALELVWATSPKLALFLGFVTLLAGVLPSAVAWVGARIVDSVVAAGKTHAAGGSVDLEPVIFWVLVEALMLVIITGAHRGITLCQSLFKAQLSHRVNVMILEKALTLELTHFEDSEFYDKLTRARREASSRPLSLVMRTSGLLQSAISIVTFSVLLAGFSPWAVAILVACGLPAFFAETKFSGDAFRLFRWRAPETSMQTYLERRWRVRTTPRSSNYLTLASCSSGVTSPSTKACTTKTENSPFAVRPGASPSRCSVSPRCTAPTPGAPSKQCAV